MPKMYFTEQAMICNPTNKVLAESASFELPEIIFPEIRAITANKKTRNKTFYSTESLKGLSSKGTGIHSVLYPYPIPIIQDHQTHPGMLGGGASPIYGRAKRARFVESINGDYVSVIAAITDPEAIFKVLTERFLTVSVGVESDAVFCSICNIDFATGETCQHEKGHTYFLDGRPTEAYWKIGPVSFREISFVTVPSDSEAMVLSKNVGDIFNSGRESSNTFWIFPPKQNERMEFMNKQKTSPETKTKDLNESSGENHVEQDKIPLAILTDPVYHTSYPILHVTKDTVENAAEELNKLTFNESDMEGIRSKLSLFCDKNGIERPENLKDVQVTETDTNTVVIELNKDTYPVLYSYIDSLRSKGLYADKVEEGMEKPKVEETASSEEPTSAAQTDTPDASWKTHVFNSTESDWTVEEKAQIREKLGIVEADVNEISSLKEELVTATTELEGLKEKVMDGFTLAHQRLAESVAILATVLSKPIAKDKSLDEVATEFTKRINNSLQDTLNDYLLEFAERKNFDAQALSLKTTTLKDTQKIASPPIEVEKLESVETPVITTDDTGLVGKALKELEGNGSISGISVEEDKDSSVRVLFGIKKENVNKRVQKHALHGK